MVNLNIGFEELWTCSFIKKIFVYLNKQRQYKKALTKELMRIKPDITISLLRREINFINDIKDGSRKIGEMHINRANYRNFNTENASLIKNIFSKIWSYSLLRHLQKLDKLVVLTEKDRKSWVELNNVVTIPDPLSLSPMTISPLTEKRVVAIARYSHEKGIDLLLKAWSKAEKETPDWRLDVFGDGDRTSYEQLIDELGIDGNRCQLHARTNDVEKEYCNSSIFVLSSRFEGFGMVITEAMACGLGPRSIISDGKDGILVENGNIDALASALSRMMCDDNLRHFMSSNGIRNVQRFKMETIGNQWKTLFESNQNFCAS